MQTTNPLIAWIQENFQRLLLKSPKFFKIWRIILGVPVLVIAIPNALEVLNINLPQLFNDHVTTIVSWASTAAFLMTFLPVKDTEVPVVKEKLSFSKAAPMIAVLISLSIGMHAQSFFGSIPKPKALQGFVKTRAMTAVQIASLTKSEFRPVTNLASYIVGGNVKEASIISGAGVGYERLQYNTETEKWKIIWSVNALAYGRIALRSESNGKKFMYGMSIGAFDNLIMAGFATDGVNGYGTLGVGIPLNNL